MTAQLTQVVTPYGCSRPKLDRVLSLAANGLANNEIANIVKIGEAAIEQILKVELVPQEMLDNLGKSNVGEWTYEDLRDAIATESGKRIANLQLRAGDLTTKILQRMDIMLATGADISFRTLSDAAKTMYAIASKDQQDRAHQSTPQGAVQQAAIMRVNIDINGGTTPVIDMNGKITAINSNTGSGTKTTSLVNMSPHELRTLAGVSDTHGRSSAEPKLRDMLTSLDDAELIDFDLVANETLDTDGCAR
jgi:hypothetical protein